jgi:hypothetical protein
MSIFSTTRALNRCLISLFINGTMPVSLGGITKVLSDEVKSVMILSRCHSNFPVIPLTIDTSVKQLNT